MPNATKEEIQPRLLVVDDESIVCESCARILGPQGYAVETTTDSHAGLSRALSTNFDAIVLDIKMPALDGIAFLDRLHRASRRLPLRTPPVIAISGYADKRAESAAHRLGIDAYLHKPFSPEELRKAVGTAVKKHRASAPGTAWARVQAASLAAADAHAIERLRIVNHSGDRVTLIAAGLLRRDSGPGRAVVEGLLAANYPVEVTLGKRCDRFRAAIDEIPRCERLLILEWRDSGQRPGTIACEPAGEWARGGGLGEVSLVTMQPAAEAATPAAFDAATSAQIAEALAALMT